MARFRIALLALPLGLFSACGDSSGSSGGDAQNPPPPAAALNDIDIVVGASGLTTAAFNPNPKAVSLAGNASVSVRWVNKDITGGDYTTGTATTHNIASDNAAFATSGPLGGNGTFSTSFTAAGSYPYHCAIHPNMVGTVTVTQ